LLPDVGNAAMNVVMFTISGIDGSVNVIFWTSDFGSLSLYAVYIAAGAMQPLQNIWSGWILGPE